MIYVRISINFTFKQFVQTLYQLNINIPRSSLDLYQPCITCSATLHFFSQLFDASTNYTILTYFPVKWTLGLIHNRPTQCSLVESYFLASNPSHNTLARVLLCLLINALLISSTSFYFTKLLHFKCSPTLIHRHYNEFHYSSLPRNHLWNLSLLAGKVSPNFDTIWENIHIE
jgi:hypothetical protein